MNGVNLGGWISQFAKYDINHFETFITRDDIEYIAGLGFDHVRVPVDYSVLEDEGGSPKEAGFKYIDNCFRWCSEFKLNMVIDLHECFGYSFDPQKVDMDKKKFFFDEALQERFFRLWERIITRYADYPDNIAFEPLNEVVPVEVIDAWNGIVGKYIKLVRSIAPKSFIIVGGVNYNNVMTVKELRTPKDDRVVYNFHCYEPMVFTHQGAYWMPETNNDFRTTYPKTLEEYRKEQEAIGLGQSKAIDSGDGMIGVSFFERIFEDAMKPAREADVALYCGEYGTIDQADNESKLRWLIDIRTAFKKCGIGCALWNYKEKDFGIVDESFSSIKERFIDSMKNI